MINKALMFLFVSILIGCHSSKSVVDNSKKNNALDVKKRTNSENILNYVAQYKNIAMHNMKNFNIPASIILAQGILESGAGQSKLALTANNHFGIKCLNDWKGETTFHDDDLNQECFRKYKNPQDSYQDHAELVSQRKRYASLFQLAKGDFKAWAYGLKEAGYATDLNYPQKLISYIDQYELHQYDQQVLGKKFESKKTQETNLKNNQYQVKKGDTLYSISKKFNISVEELKNRNGIFENSISEGKYLYIK